jgi:ribosomal-protein-alanine N-acetyltransferase
LVSLYNKEVEECAMAHLIKERKKNDLLCNVCGRALRIEKGILLEDAFVVSKEWGFFSSRDLEVHRFTICEDCYDKLIAHFKIPIEVIDKSEAL